LAPDPDPSGEVQTFTTDPSGQIDSTSAFFQSLGTNGRTCATCHLQSDGWSISAAHVLTRFNQATFDANGVASDPIFQTDGATCDHNVDLTTATGRTQAFSLLTSRGLIRIPRPVPTGAGAEFTVDSVVSPYACNETSPLSMYRRPLPTANLRFVSTLMWDGRESSALTLTQDITKATNPADLLADLAHQAVDATLIHAQGQVTAPLTPDQQKAIVNFEMALSVAQSSDAVAGLLKTDVTSGGPAQIAATAQQFSLGVNAPFSTVPFTRTIFTLFDSWGNYPNDNTVDTQKASIGRGQSVFNNKTIIISGVAGFNDVFTGGINTSFAGSCGYCHNSPNVGNHSLAAPMNIGVADVGNPLNPLDVSYLPVITLRNTTANPPSPATVQTTDPGVALVTGKWADIGKVKVPILRGLAARAPYFHNGSAQTLSDVVNFYDKRFNIGFTPQEKTDLIAFLSSL
jgi:cytochrome c peroxidase